MATFTTWDRNNRKPAEEIQITKDEVESYKDYGSRDQAGNMVACTRLRLWNGEEHCVMGPAGEFHDRLNDDEAEAPHTLWDGEDA